MVGGMWFSIRLDDHASLRPVTVLDAEEIYALLDSERERFGMWLPWMDSVRSADDERRFMAMFAEQWASLSGLMGALVVDGRIVGSVGIARVDKDVRCAEIGYWIGSAYEGRGLVTRGVRAIEELCFEQLGMQRVQITNDVDNRRSRAVAERLGYTLEGVVRRGHVVGVGERRRCSDMCVYGLLREEWLARERRGDGERAAGA